MTVPVTEIARALTAFYGSRRTPFLRSQPGIGKTDMVHIAAAEITDLLKANNWADPELAVHELHLASVSEVDIRGYLIPHDGKATFTAPPFWSAIERSPRGILFLDEFAQATHEVQKAVAPLLLDGRVGDYKLPEGWMVVCAANRAEDNAGANSLLSHVINRLCLINVVPASADEWLDWATTMQLCPEIIITVKQNPKLILEAPNLEIEDEPYCTPRSIHALSDVAKRWYNGLPGMCQDKVGMACIAGFVGAGAAAEINATVLLTSKLPQYSDIVANPMGVKLPTAPNEVYASIMMTALRAELQHADPVSQYITRFQPNMAVIGLAALLNRDGKFTQAAGVSQWVAANRPMMQKLSRHIRTRKA
jgi:hypothetical protein